MNALTVAKFGLFVGMSISFILNLDFGYKFGLENFSSILLTIPSPKEIKISVIGFFTCVIFGTVDFIKCQLGKLFSRLIVLNKKLEASFLVALGVIVYIAFIGLSASSTNSFFADKVQAQQSSSPTHLSVKREIYSINKSIDFYENEIRELLAKDQRIIKEKEKNPDLNVSTTGNQRKLHMQKIEKLEIELKIKENEFNNLPKGNHSWFARNGEIFGKILTFVLEIFIFFCAFSIASIEREDGTKNNFSSSGSTSTEESTSNVQGGTTSVPTGCSDYPTSISSTRKAGEGGVYSNALSNEQIALIILNDNINSSYKNVRCIFSVGQERVKKIRLILGKLNNESKEIPKLTLVE